ncbi:MAG TPA: transglycosylase SLT domain-containing protein [Candidatus Kapabacteria bacterium]|nr:transglycosylase SLT domain-containing protein [Candidatus Kapabacteria bacterium]
MNILLFALLMLRPAPSDAVGIVASAVERSRAQDSTEAADIFLIPFRREIDSVSRIYHLPSALVAAFVQEESEFEPFAIRTEPSYLRKKKVIAAARLWCRRHRGLPSAQTELVLRASSLGLMQPMGELAREQGFDAAYLSELLAPNNSLGEGAKYLAKLLKRYPHDTLSAISAYNQGTPRRRGRTFENARYVYRVAVAWRAYEKIFQQKKIH